MRYHVLATDYDGTLAHNGHVDDATVQSLQSFLASGRRLVMVTGRELPELLEVLELLELLDVLEDELVEFPDPHAVSKASRAPVAPLTKTTPPTLITSRRLNPFPMGFLHKFGLFRFLPRLTTTPPVNCARCCALEPSRPAGRFSAPAIWAMRCI